MDVKEKKHKKRKHGESSVLGGEDVQLDDGGRQKKSKIEGLCDNIGGEGSEDNRYRKEKKREKRRLRVEEANNGDKVGGEAEKGSVVEGSDRERMNGNEGGDVMNPEVGAVIEELKDKKEKKKSKSNPEIEGLSGNAGANASEDNKSRKEKKREKRRLRADEANNGDKVGGKVEKGSVVEGSDGNSTYGNESGGVMNPEVGTVIEEVNDKKEKKKKSKSKPKVEGLSGNGVSEVVVNGEASVSEKVEHEEGQKKKKKKEKDSVEGLRGDSASEVLPIEEAILIDKVELEHGQKKKKKKKEKDSAGALRGTGASEVVLDGEVSVSEKVEHEESQKKKKKKEKASAEGIRDNGVSEVVLDGVASVRENVEHEEGQKKKKRKKEKDSAVVGHVEDVESVKDKKRTKKKESGTHLASDSDREGKRDGASKKRKKKSLANNTEENANGGVSVNNQSNEPTESAKQSNPSKKQRKVKFADTVEVFPLPDNLTEGEENLQDEGQTSEGEENLEDSNEKNSDDGLVRGKRFSKEEDEMVRNAVLQYIEDHKLGEEGVNMVMKCSKHKETKECWKEIAEALPWRTRMSIYSRAHILFERGESSTWSKEELEMVRQYHEKHGPKWRELADEMGRNRIHVKDAFRQVKLANKKTGHWSQEEYQNLFNLVNKDLRIRAFMDRKSKHGMLRDNIGWEAISDQLTTRTDPVCCVKWYDQLTSALVASGEWADSDDYRLLMALDEIDATCEEEVDWDYILEHRSGDMCRKRWYEMVRHIGKQGNKSFSEQVEILSQRYCPDVLEARETYDSKPFVDK